VISIGVSETIANKIVETIEKKIGGEVTDLNKLNVHNVIEHDASLSRLDSYFGNSLDFNQKRFDLMKKFVEKDESGKEVLTL